MPESEKRNWNSLSSPRQTFDIVLISEPEAKACKSARKALRGIVIAAQSLRDCIAALLGRKGFQTCSQRESERMMVLPVATDGCDVEVEQDGSKGEQEL